ncbi:MAG TPA: ABC transporter substrate-binding protein [Ilumatobacter sp.]|nr:ABC transporter substrate-binding protein [Ilumatobacter sp.]
MCAFVVASCGSSDDDTTEPDDNVTTTDNGGTTTEPDDDGTTTEPDAGGTTTEPDDSGTTTEPDDGGTTTEPPGDSIEPADGGNMWDPSRPHEGSGTVRVRLVSDWGSSLLPPTRAINPATYLMNALYDRLLVNGPDGALVPWLAVSWEVSPTEIVFTLRDDATCADGTPVTATVVADSINFWVDPATESAWVGNLGPGPVSALADDSANTVTVTSGTPFNELLQGFAISEAGIVCPAGLVDGADDSLTAFGSGPYVLTAATHDQGATLTRREDYTWGPFGLTSADLPEQLEFVVVNEESTAANLLETGELDYGYVRPPDAERLIADGDLNAVEHPSYGSSMLSFRLDRPAWQDPEVRRALLSAIDPMVWTELEHGTLGRYVPGYFGEGMDCYADLTEFLPTPDPQAAQDALVSLGWTLDGDKLVKDGEQMSILFLGSLEQGVAAEYVQSVYESIGISVELRIIEFTGFGAALREGDWDMATPQYSGSTNPQSMARFMTPTGPNLSALDDEQLTALAEEALSAPLEERCEPWREFEEYFATQWYGIPVGQRAFMWFDHGDVQGYSNGPMFQSWSIMRLAE